MISVPNILKTIDAIHLDYQEAKRVYIALLKDKGATQEQISKVFLPLSEPPNSWTDERWQLHRMQQASRTIVKNLVLTQYPEGHRALVSDIVDSLFVLDEILV